MRQVALTLQSIFHYILHEQSTHDQPNNLSVHESTMLNLTRSSGKTQLAKCL